MPTLMSGYFNDLFGFFYLECCTAGVHFLYLPQHRRTCPSYVFYNTFFLIDEFDITLTACAVFGGFHEMTWNKGFLEAVWCTGAMLEGTSRLAKPSTSNIHIQLDPRRRVLLWNKTLFQYSAWREAIPTMKNRWLNQTVGNKSRRR